MRVAQVTTECQDILYNPVCKFPAKVANYLTVQHYEIKGTALATNTSPLFVTVQLWCEAQILSENIQLICVCLFVYLYFIDYSIVNLGYFLLVKNMKWRHCIKYTWCLFSCEGDHQASGKTLKEAKHQGHQKREGALWTKEGTSLYPSTAATDVGLLFEYTASEVYIQWSAVESWLT